MEVGVAGADPVDAVLAHQHCGVKVVEQVAANIRQLRQYPCQHCRMTLRRHQQIEPRRVQQRVAPRIVRVGYPFDSGSHKMLWSRESIYQEANPEVTALARRGAA